MKNMKQKIFVATLSLILFFSFWISSLPALADCTTPQSAQEALQCGANNGTTNPQNSAQAGTSLDTTVRDILSVMSVIVGTLAIVMIIIAGLRYITSGGKQESVTGAKNTLLYAVIGLVIVALAQIIVHFVLNRTGTATTGGLIFLPGAIIGS